MRRESKDIPRSQLLAIIADLRGIMYDAKMYFFARENRRESHIEKDELIKAIDECIERTGFDLSLSEEVDGGFDPTHRELWRKENVLTSQSPLPPLPFPRASIIRRVFPPKPVSRPTDPEVWARYVEEHECYIAGHKGVRDTLDQITAANYWMPVTQDESFAINDAILKRRRRGEE